MKKTLVFGASLKNSRYSNLAMRKLSGMGIETLGFGLREGEAHGVPVRRTLGDIRELHTITLYMNPRRQREFYEDIVRLHPKRVIFNPGTENPELIRLLEKEGIETEVACTLVLLSAGMY